MENSILSNHNFINFIEKTVSYNTVSHAYLIEISDYDKDFPLIVLFVKLLLCKNSINHVSKLNCKKCNICNLVEQNYYIDDELIEIIRINQQYEKDENILQVIQIILSKYTITIS